MKFTALKTDLNRKIYAVYVVAGPDAYLRAAAESLIRQKAAPDFPEMNVNYLPPEVNAAAAVDCFNTLPLLSAYKVVVLRGYEPSGEDAKKRLIEYVKNPNPSAVAVFVSQSDFLKKLADTYPDVCAYVDCAHLDGLTIKKWLRQSLAASAVTIGEAAADLLCQYCGYDMTRLASELPKLAALGAPALTEAHIQELVAPESAYQVYELSGKISAKDPDKALLILQSLLQKNEAPSALLTMIYNHFRRMFYVSVSAGASDAALARDLGVKEYAVTKARESLSAYRPARLKKILDALYRAETLVKTGKMKDTDALYYAVLKIL